MKKLVTLTCATLLAANAYAAAPATAERAAPVISPAEKTSALFYSTCAASNGSQKDFTKKMQSLVDSKTAVKMGADKLAGMVNPEEAKNAWAVKGFADANKPILLTYNAAQKVCGMHVADIAPDDMRHAFQADLKKLVDLTAAKVKIYKPEKKDDLTAYSVDLTANKKVMQLGIAISAKAGQEFLTVHVQD